MVSILDILSGLCCPIVDVRQSGGRPVCSSSDPLLEAGRKLEATLRTRGRVDAFHGDQHLSEVYYFYVSSDTVQLEAKVKAAHMLSLRPVLVGLPKNAFHTKRTVARTSIEEFDLIARPSGREVIELTNSSNAAITRRLSLSREFSKTVVVQTERTKTFHAGIEVSAVQMVKGSAYAENVIRQQYGVTLVQKESYTDEVSIEVPAKTDLQVFVQWKEIWRSGIVHVTEAEMPIVTDYPFETLIRVTFDVDVRQRPESE